MSMLRKSHIEKWMSGVKVLVSYFLILAASDICRAESGGNLLPDTSVRQESAAAIGANPAVETGVPANEVKNLTASGVDTLKTIAQNGSIVRIFKKGGPIMWPLLFASILALGTVIERLLFVLGVNRSRDAKGLEKFFTAVAHSDIGQAIEIADKSKFYVVRTLGYALAHKGKSLASALMYAQEQEMKQFRYGIPILDTVITLAPLLGLLGTVTGMMGSFSLIGGELSAPGAITGGIAEALIATAFGLGIAITSLIPFNFLNTRMERARTEIETAAKKFELLMHPQKRIAVISPILLTQQTLKEESYAQAV